MTLQLDIITIFPDYLAPLGLSLLGKAREGGLVDVRVHDLRRWTDDLHRTVDDAPYGGGPGMVMKAEPWAGALEEVVAAGGPVAAPRLIVPTPAGRPFTQVLAQDLAAEPWLMFACGRYEGIDGRFVDHAREHLTVDEISLGDYVLAGGEVAVLVIVEAVARLVPGVLGNAASHQDDSFAAGEMEGLLEAAVYTRPPHWRGRDVPVVLQSGDHARIARWRRDQALRRTAAQRPDLLARLAGRLDRQDLAGLADAGFDPPPGPVAP